MADNNDPSPLAGEGGARTRERVGGRGGATRAHAKAMRSDQTAAEKRLWSILRAKRLAGFKFKRQVPVDHYIADFVSFERRVIIEADGSQHLDSASDQTRDAYLEGEGFRILRFWNSDILKNPDGVAEAILAALETPLSQPLSRKGREE